MGTKQLVFKLQPWVRGLVVRSKRCTALSDSEGHIIYMLRGAVVCLLVQLIVIGCVGVLFPLRVRSFGRCLSSSSECWPFLT